MPHDSAQQTPHALNSTTTLREPDAAAYIGLSRAFLRAARLGRGTPGPAYVRIGRAVRYRVRDLDAFLEQHVVARVG
jgi:predicted DNA-binding transcriptional regulator AlpA